MKNHKLKTFILTTILAISFGFNYSFAQTGEDKTTLGDNLRTISQSIKVLVSEINDLVNQYREGEITEEELEEEIAKLEEKIETETAKIGNRSDEMDVSVEIREETIESMEEMMENLEDEMEELERTIEVQVEREMERMENDIERMENDMEEQDNRIEVEDNSIKINLNKNPRPAKQTRKDFVLGFGPTYVIENSDNDNFVPDFKPWSSWSGYLGFQMATRFTPTSNFGIQYGILYKWMITKIDDNAILTIQDRNGIYVPDSERDYSKSSLTTHHLVVPLMLQISNKRGKGYTFGLGGYAGVRLGDTQKLHFRSVNGEKVESRLRANYRTNPFIYGLGANFGKDFVRFFAHYDLSNVWRTEDNYDWNRFNFGFHLHF